MPRRIRPLVGITYTESNLVRGIVRDSPRSAIPPGGVYDAVDFFLNDPGVARKRGGTVWAGPALTGATYARALAYAPYTAGGKLVGVGDNGHIYSVNETTTTDLGGSTVSAMLDRPKFRMGGNQLMVFPVSDGTTSPVKWDGSGAPAALGGSPPAGRFAEVYATRLVLGWTAANPNRLHFSPTPDIESTWDTANAWIDANHEISGLAALQNALLIFSEHAVERLIGATPPPGSDMDLKQVMSVGCSDARSIVVNGGNVIFANPGGVYLTNGVAQRCLTTEGGIESLWQSQFSTGYDYSTWTISAGVFGTSYLFITVSDHSGALNNTFCCFLPRVCWTRLSNVNAAMWASSSNSVIQGGEDLFYADRQAPRTVAMSTVFNPTEAYANDANGDPVEPVLEYRPVVGYGSGLKSFGMSRITYDMRATTPPHTSPTLRASFKTGIQADTTHVPSDGLLAATSRPDRRRVKVFNDSNALTINLTQTGPSSSTEIYSCEVEARDYGYYDQTHDGVGTA